MKLVILVACVVAVVAAVPVDPIKHVNIVRSEYDPKPNGGYRYEFETEDGVDRYEIGEIKEVLDEDNKPHNVIGVRGSFTYTDPEGKVQTINYVADEKGYRAEGDAIPKVPERR